MKYKYKIGHHAAGFYDMESDREFAADEFVNNDLTKDSPDEHKKSLLELIVTDLWFEGKIYTTQINKQVNIKVWLSDGHEIKGKLEIEITPSIYGLEFEL